MRWRRESERIAREHLEKHGERVAWAIVDGFLLYWSQVRSFVILAPFIDVYVCCARLS